MRTCTQGCFDMNQTNESNENLNVASTIASTARASTDQSNSASGEIFGPSPIHETIFGFQESFLLSNINSGQILYSGDPLLHIPGQDCLTNTGWTNVRSRRSQLGIPPSYDTSSSSPSPFESSVKVYKKSRYKSASLRAESSLTRTLNSCVRCRSQHIRCSPDPNNLNGPCLPCTRALLRISTLPCLRYKIIDSNLYRTAFYHYPFFREHLMVGPSFGDFHIQRQWIPNQTRVLELAQDSNTVLCLTVREFEPSPEELRSDDTRGNKMYDIPWAVADPEEAAAAVNLYLDFCIGPYLDTILDDSNRLVWDIFHWALRLSLFPQPNKLLADVIRLWVACRFLEGRWRCVGSNTFGAENLSHWYGTEPIVQVPPFLNYQMAAIFTEKILQPLRVAVLKRLQDLILAKETKNWFSITLSVFILLHNYELQCQFHRAFARRRGFPVRFVEMPIIRAIHSGAKTILAYFHYGCKGQRPFSADYDWDTDEAKSMADLDDEQISFIKHYQHQIQNNGQVRTVSQTHDYEEEYWFVGQLFDPDWVPRQTHEYSLPA